MNAPLVLKLGMEKAEVLVILERVDAEDLVHQKIYSKYHVYVPTGDPEIDADANAEFRREQGIQYSAENLKRFFYHPAAGRFEIRFKNGSLGSIIRWSGERNENVELLRIPQHTTGWPQRF